MQSCSPSADDALRVLAVDGDELGEVDLPARQGLGELQAQARGGGLRFGLVVDHAEAVLGAQLVVELVHARVVGEGEARLKSVDGGAPVGAPLQCGGENDECVRLQLRFLRALVGEVGRARGVHRKIVALAALVGIGLDREQRARKPEPGGGILPSATTAPAKLREAARGSSPSARSPSARSSAPCGRQAASSP